MAIEIEMTDDQHRQHNKFSYKYSQPTQVIWELSPNIAHCKKKWIFYEIVPRSEWTWI